MTRLLPLSEINDLLAESNSLREDRFEYINPAWLAGFIDGEGSFHFITIRSGYKLPRVTIAQTNYEILDSIKTIYSGSISEQNLGGNTKIAWRWQLSGVVRIRNLLTDIRPFLKLKDRQADLVLEFLNLVLTDNGYRRYGISEEILRRRELIISEVSKLNKRGLK